MGYITYKNRLQISSAIGLNRHRKSSASSSKALPSSLSTETQGGGGMADDLRLVAPFALHRRHQVVRTQPTAQEVAGEGARPFLQVFNLDGGRIDQDALAMMADADMAVAEVKRGLVAAGCYISMVIVTDTGRSPILSPRRCGSRRWSAFQASPSGSRPSTGWTPV